MIKLIQSLIDYADKFAYPYVTFGVFGLFSYPIYYFIWLNLNPQGYENLEMRIIATFLCVPLIFQKNWPISIRPYISIYWYLTIMYCLPLFFTFILLKNNFSYPTALNGLAALLLYILLLDVLMMFVFLFTGCLLGYLLFKLTSNSFHFEANFFVAIVSYASVLVFCIFAHKREQIQQEKLQTLKIMGMSVAHELRTPLRTISSAVNGIKKYFPTVMKGYQIAKEKELLVPYISPKHFEVLLAACDDIESETQVAFTTINIFLMNATKKIDYKNFKDCLINKCIDEAIRRYPFDRDEENLVDWVEKNEFQFRGEELLVVHIIFNLIKNSLYQIKAADRGKIEIWTEIGKKFNVLHFKDTAAGISVKTMPYIFNHFFSLTDHGTGIGLAFCKMVMEKLGGKIHCHSKENKFAEFLLYFPKKK